MKAAGQERRKAFFNSQPPCSAILRPTRVYTHKTWSPETRQKALLSLSRYLLRNTIASGSSTLSSPVPIPLQTVTSLDPRQRCKLHARIRDQIALHICIYSSWRSVFIDLLHCPTNLSCDRRVHVSSLSAFHSTFLDVFVVVVAVKRVRYARQCTRDNRC